ncbi:MAG: hypothetical protein HZB17_08380 [Chloroflexi bacterium]|nr:hypothetical protein [Chloroflexota bacterium]
MNLLLDRARRHPFLIASLALVAAHIILRFASAQLEPRLESVFGIFPITQRWGAMSWLWGFRSTAPLYLSRWVVVLGVTLAVAVGATRAMRQNVWARWIDPLSTRNRFLLFAAITFLFAAFFWLMRLKIAWGDYARYTDYMLRGLQPGQTSNPNSPTILFMSSPLGTTLFYIVWRILNPFGWSPEETVAMSNVIAGAIYVFSLLILVHQWKTTRRVAVFAVLASLPAVTMFFGYIEVTPLSAALSVTYFAIAQSWLDKPALAKSLGASLVLGLAFTSHGWAGVLLPSLIFLLLVRPASSRLVQWIGSLALFALPSLVFRIAATLRPDWVYGPANGDSGNFQFAIFTQGLSAVFRDECLTAQFPNLCYRLLSPHQFVDVASFISRMSPVLFALVLIALFKTSEVAHTAKTSEVWRTAFFWILVTIFSAAFLFYWPPAFGLEHDWDLYAPSVIAVTIAIGGITANLPPAFWDRADVRYSLAVLFSWNVAGMLEHALYLQAWLFREVILKIFT